MRSLPVVAGLALWLSLQAQTPSSPPDTEIFLATLNLSSGSAVVRPVNITNSPGYDNQPSFSPDGRAILFTSIRGGSQTDIYRYTISSREVTRVTNTPESEYSPTVTPDRAHISVIRVEADGTQRLWQFTSDGQQPQLVLNDIKPVGYHAWTDAQTLALFVLGQPATLQLADTRTGKAETLARNIGRSLQTIPLRGTVSFVEREPVAENAATLHVRELDPKTKAITPLVDAPAGSREADLAWAPDGLLLVAKDDGLYGWRRTDAAGGWKKLADLRSLGLTGVSRIAVSPAGDRIAFVTQAPLTPAAK
jgi:dipeptidyl aminopeptidase/acylaminoacyl peptidase